MTLVANHKWSGKRGQGQTAQWLRDHVLYAGDACLIWPFSGHPTGYGSLGHNGRQHYAHRFMCELVHGPAPSSRHYASHHCGNGHKGCVHPRHLAWKTSSENARDRVRHGNNWKKGERVRYAKLTRAKADQIRALKGVRTQYVLAAEFGVSRETISHIHCGRMWPAKRRG